MMSYWAEIDDDGFVLRVTVGSNNDHDEGLSWLVENLGGTWIKTSYNATIRKNFAGVGYRYDSDLDAFIPPRPFPSWVLNIDTCKWEATEQMPEHGLWNWNEETKTWIEIQETNEHEAS